MAAFGVPLFVVSPYVTVAAHHGFADAAVPALPFVPKLVISSGSS
ncbi:MAG TPA: hypothetical protein VK427_16075 [Kofleriaceae bacterium]|nr:hypothetical protein [Kofleriaceae bacterium]